MTKTIYMIWCEWDIGTEGSAFTSLEKAKECAKQCWEDQEIEDDFEDCWDDFIGVNEVHYYDS